MRLPVFGALLVAIAASGSAAVEAASPNIHDQIIQRLVASGRMGMAFDTSSAGSLIATTPSGPVTVSAGVVTITAPMHGSGSLIKLGPGTMTLAASNGDGGATTINSGTLQISRGSNSPFGFLIQGGA